MNRLKHFLSLPRLSVLCLCHWNILVTVVILYLTALQCITGVDLLLRKAMCSMRFCNVTDSLLGGGTHSWCHPVGRVNTYHRTSAMRHPKRDVVKLHRTPSVCSLVMWRPAPVFTLKPVINEWGCCSGPCGCGGWHVMEQAGNRASFCLASTAVNLQGPDLWLLTVVSGLLWDSSIPRPRSAERQSVVTVMQRVGAVLRSLRRGFHNEHRLGRAWQGEWTGYRFPRNWRLLTPGKYSTETEHQAVQRLRKQTHET